jgi:hypothetical protein
LEAKSWQRKKRSWLSKLIWPQPAQRERSLTTAEPGLWQIAARGSNAAGNKIDKSANAM